MNTEELQDAYGEPEGLKLWGRGFSKSEEAAEAAAEQLRNRVDDLEERIYQEEQRQSWNRLAEEIHPTNVEKGFWEPPVMMDKYVAKMMLVVTETAEVVEALRKSQGKDKVTEEFADIFIRALDLYGKLVADGEADPALYGVLRDKMKVNAERPPKHGNRWG